MKIKSVMHEGKARLRQRREKKREQIRSELERYGSEILHSDEMREAFRQTHHTRSTVGEHTQRVAEKSLAICHALEKLHIRTDIPAVVAASLCHDLGILGRDEKYGAIRIPTLREALELLASEQGCAPEEIRYGAPGTEVLHGAL